jgi:1-deoxy-D-xylulose-5-phosphate reductoisomerase
MKNIAVLGSTGSIGTQTLEVVRSNSDFRVSFIAANTNIDLLYEQFLEFRPEAIGVYDYKAADLLKERLKDENVEILYGMEGLIEGVCRKGIDIVVTAMVGMIGLRPTIEAIKMGSDIALANKETLVTAGHIIMKLAKENNVKILPVDSEHSAIFQCLNGESKRDIDKILLTASGGPFRGMKREEMKKVTLSEALKHPNWSMGKKITIDSATMVNKGLEVIEAKWLFDVDFDNIEVIVQPQSLIHSMILFNDGAIMAQLGTPDMKLPIQYALTYPERRFLKGARVDFDTLSQINFSKPDFENFKGLKLAYEAGRKGGTLTTVYNAANEYAVNEFLNERISYLEITDIIEFAMDRHKITQNPDLEKIIETEKEVYEIIKSGYKIGGSL